MAASLILVTRLEDELLFLTKRGNKVLRLNDDIKKREDENELEFIWRLGEAKTNGILDMTWEE